MSRWNSRLLSVMLVGVLLVGVGCGGESDQPMAPSGNAPQAAIISTVVSGVESTLLGTVDLLTCTSLPYASVSATVGPQGGTIRVGKSTLVIPRGALANTVTIKAEQMSGKVNSIRFSPEGLRFAQPAQLTMSYDNCLVILPTKRIVYTTETLKVLEILKSLDLRLTRMVSAPIDHFSRYAIAY
ncbi:MAG TPA: hypothetical protein VJQ46_09325 [Gemmatimonadales bacterium]|nr:hypothetical protein [Gemmatimonadales bacterium]